MAIRFDQIELAGSGHDLYPIIHNAGGNGLRITTATGYGDFGSANTSYFHISTDRPTFYISKPVSFDGNLSAYGGTETISNFASVSASTFTSKDDTNYFVNPNGSSSLYTPVTMSTNDTTLTFQDAGTNAFQIKVGEGDELYLGSNNNYQLQMTTSGNVNTQGDWRFGAKFIKVGNSSTYNSDDGSWGSRFVVSSTVHARIDCAQDANAVRASWYTHTGQLYSTFGTVTGHDMRLMSHNTSRQWLYSTHSEETASYRAPIFYDSNDTGYYSDMNGQSVLYNLKLSGAKHTYLEINPGSSHESMVRYMGSAGSSWYVGKRTSTQNGISTSDFHWYSEAAAATVGGITTGGHLKTIGSIQSPIFYDSNNTGYFLDPQNKSTLHSLKLDGIITGTASGCAEYGRNHAYHTPEIKGYGAEFMIGAQHTSININYRTCNNGASGHTPTDWYWRAGSATSFANMYMAQMSSSTNARAPIFYDSNDTNYYIDPASTGDAVKINGSIRIDSTHSGGNLFLYYHNSDTANRGTLTGWVSEPGMTYADAGIGANIHQSGPYYGRSIDSGYGVYINFKKTSGEMLFRNTTATSGSSGGQGTTRMTIGASGDITASSSFRAPIFYDSNDTSFYVDAASTSNLNIVKSYSYQGNGNVGGTGSASWHPSGIYSAGYNWLYGGINGGGNSATNFGDVRANIFYDNQNTGYYVDPNGTSKTSINIIDGRLTIGQSSDAGSTYRLYIASGGQQYFGGHTVASSITMSGTLNVTGQYANVGNLNFEGIGNSPIGTGYGSGKLLGYDQLNGSGRAAATLGVNNQGIVMEYEKIMTFKIEGNGWVNRSSNPYKLIQAPGADKMIVVDEFLVYIDYATRTGLGSNGIALSYEQAAYSVGFYLNETGQSISTANHGVSSTFYTAGVMPGGFMNTSLDRGYYRDVPVHQSALIANRSLFFKTSRNCSSSSNAPGGAHYIKIKYRVIDISEEFNAAGCNQTIDVSGYHGQYAHDADGEKRYNDSGQATF